MANTTTPVTVEATGLTGDRILSAVVGGRRERFHWAGPGAQVRLVWAQTLVSIDTLAGWQAADLAEAKAQVRDFARSCAKAGAQA